MCNVLRTERSYEVDAENIGEVLQFDRLTWTSVIQKPLMHELNETTFDGLAAGIEKISACVGQSNVAPLHFSEQISKFCVDMYSLRSCLLLFNFCFSLNFISMISHAFLQWQSLK